VDAEELENKDVQLYLYYLDKFAEVKNLRRVKIVDVRIIVAIDNSSRGAR